MIFEALNDAADHGELILVDGGLCHWHQRRDGSITIREIIVLPTMRGRGIGSAMLQQLLDRKPTVIRATCPADLPANAWYPRRGFVLATTTTTKSGRSLNVWEHRS